MAITIIKAGTKEKMTCDICGCIFTFEAEDYVHFENDQVVEGYKDGYTRWVICPQCNTACQIGVKRYKTIES